MYQFRYTHISIYIYIYIYNIQRDIMFNFLVEFIKGSPLGQAPRLGRKAVAKEELRRVAKELRRRRKRSSQRSCEGLPRCFGSCVGNK